MTISSLSTFPTSPTPQSLLVRTAPCQWTIAWMLLLGLLAPLATLGAAEGAQSDDPTTTAPMPLRIINPRQGVSGNTIYTLWHPDVPMDVPIQVQGGSFPFRYELSGPAGMTLGADYGQPDHGILRWNDPTPGTHEITVTVTDQEGTVVKRNYTLDILDDREATDHIIFVDAAAEVQGVGTIDRPLQDIADAQAEEHNGKTVIVREGRYTVTGTGFQKVPRWIGHPGETVDFINRKLATNWETGDGACININWKEIHQDVVYGRDIKHGNGGCMRVWHGGVGFVGYRLSFHDFLFHEGEPGNLNQSCIMFPNTEVKENVGLSDIEMDTFAYCGIETYKVRYFLMERITARNALKGSGLAPILFHKVGSHYASTRDCSVWENIHPSRSSYEWYAGGFGKPAAHGEICFSRLVAKISHQRGPGATGFPHWFYRNTVLSTITDRSEGGAFVYAGNVICAPVAGTYQESGIKHVGKSEYLPDVSHQMATFDAAERDEVLGPDGRLIGEARRAFLGAHGHEIVLSP